MDLRYRKEGCFTKDEHRQIQDQILNVIEQGTLPKEETLRRLEQLIENEINSTDRDVNLYLVDACQALMWAVKTDSKPLPSFDARRSYQGIQKRIRREARREKAQQLLLGRLPKLIPMAAIMLLVVVLAGGGIHLVWFTNHSTPDEQQYIVRGNEITVEMVQSALAENQTTGDVVVGSYEELLAMLPFIDRVAPSENSWRFDGGTVHFLRTHVSISLFYINAKDDSMQLKYSLECFSSAEDAYIAYEQSIDGDEYVVDEHDVYITINEGRCTAVWHNNSAVFNLVVNTNVATTISILRELME